MIKWTGIFLCAHTLQMFNFPLKTIQLVRTGISSVNMSVLWNGEKTDFFHTSRGLRQGDPLSPFLFVIYVERLSMLVNKAVSDNRWKFFDVCRRGPKIPHLMFADDLLLFAKTNTYQAKVITDIRSEFCRLSGQSISVGKFIAFAGGGATKRD